MALLNVCGRREKSVWPYGVYGGKLKTLTLAHTHIRYKHLEPKQVHNQINSQGKAYVEN